MELVGFIGTFISFLLLFKVYKRFNDLYSLGLTIGWFSYSLYYLTNSIAIMLYFANYEFGRLMFKSKFAFFVIAIISLQISLNLVQKNSVNSRELSITLILSTLYVITNVTTNVLSFEWYNGDYSYVFPSNGVYLELIVVFVISQYIIYSYRILSYSPSTIKQDAIIHFSGILLFGPIAFLIYLFGLDWYIIGISTLVSVVGIICFSVAIYRSPQLMYILPFDVFYLSVFKTKSGLKLFSYDWKKPETNEFNEFLFISGFEAFGMFLEESLHLGKIKSMQFDDGILMITKGDSDDVHFVLIAKRDNYILRTGFDNFVKEFNSVFSDDLSQLDENLGIMDVSNYFSANLLVQSCFSYIKKEA